MRSTFCFGLYCSSSSKGTCFLFDRKGGISAIVVNGLVSGGGGGSPTYGGGGGSPIIGGGGGSGGG